MANDAVVSEKKKGKKRASEAATAEAAQPAASSESGMVVDDAEGAEAAAPKAKKAKKNKELDELPVDPSTLSPIAHPLAPRKLNKHVLRTVKKASKARHIRRGVKEVVKALKKGEKGMVVMAADISPMDILTHIPLLAEESNCPYIFVPSKELLGQASFTKRPTSCIMIVPEIRKGGKKIADPTDADKLSDLNDYRAAYETTVKEVEAVDESVPAY